jgi:methylmalonyl-CoA/ethylmalonyl-CoA epimerase
MNAALGVFRRLHHVCVVVHDIDAAQAYYERLGVGPWRAYPDLAQYVELEGPDRSAFLAMKYRFADLDNFQLQLCEPPQRDCPQRQFLDARGEGIFHLGFEVADCDAAEAQARDHGIEVLMRGRRTDRSGFTYFDTAADAGVVLEIRKSAEG